MFCCTENSSDTKTSLEKIVQYLSDAADSYIKVCFMNEQTVMALAKHLQYFCPYCEDMM